MPINTAWLMRINQIGNPTSSTYSESILNMATQLNAGEHNGQGLGSYYSEML